ncbi:MAG TPA: BamA/TamA family outer membrane protein [Edaphocola sp.]|nr:BamA/TamA family outer membrane protein [Edaphocola sp.]
MAFCLSVWPAQAQEFYLKIIPVDSGRAETKSFRQRPELWRYLHEQQWRLQEKGYLACSVDSVREKDSVVTAWLFTGKKYRWAKIDFSGVPMGLWDRLDIARRNWQDKPISPAKLAALHEAVLNYCDNNGYPFAYTYLDSFQERESGLSAEFHLVTGPLQKIDTIIVQGDVDIALPYLENYLDIFQGGLYDESALRQIRKRLDELPFLQENQPWRMDFSIDKNRLYLYLKPKKANQANALLGLQPNTQASGKFMLTADVLLGLKNSLGYGETIEASYKNLSYKSPLFQAHVIAPYILGTRFGMEGRFDLYKQDTTYRKITFEAGMRYQFSADNYFRVFYQNVGNRLITADTHYVSVNRKLPGNIDMKSQGMGMTYATDFTDYKLNPHRGWSAEITVTGAVRTVIPNDAILEMGNFSRYDYQQLYDQANVEKYQFRFMGAAAWYCPVTRSIIAKAGYQGGYIYGKNLFQNELFQIGGFHSLRGFDENSLYASQYHIASFEIHFEFGKNDFFYVFNDDAMVWTRFQDYQKKDYPLSLGAGLSLENKTGVFNIALGVGKHYQGQFQLRNAKIHFGYAAYF